MRALNSFLRRQVRPRLRIILLSGQVGVTIVVVGLVWVFTASERIVLNDVVPVGTAYTAIAIGFALAGSLSALAIPDREFVDEMMDLSVESQVGDAFSNLVFVFTWTGFVHWLLLAELLLVWGFVGTGSVKIAVDASFLQRATFAGGLAIAVYAVLQFLVAILTVSQIGSAYIAFRRGKPD